MRFIAAAMVFLFHVFWQNLFASQGAQNNFFSLFFQGGWSGVGFFFVLSGFVLTWSARASDTSPRFWRRRFFKIYPNHLVTFLVAFALLVWVSDVAVSGRDAVLNLLLVHSFFPQMSTRYSFNPVAWSLSCELLFYLCFPLLFALVKRIRPERLWFWAGGVVAAIFAVPIVATAGPEQPIFPVTDFTAWEMWFIYQFPPVRMLEFIFGILLARIVITGRRLPFDLGGAVALAIAAYAMAPLFPRNYNLVAVMVVPLGLVIAAGAVADLEGRRTWMSRRAAVWLGEVSFAFYLWQYMVVTYGHHFLGDGRTWTTPGALAVIAGMFGVTLLLSWLLYSLVERPVMRRFATSRRHTRVIEEPSPTPAATLAAAAAARAEESPTLSPTAAS
jgi:mycarose O-acyltransferase